jgi:hypothetical protein
MHRRDRALLNDPLQRGTLDFPEKRAASGRLAVHQPFRTLGIEPKHPVAHRLEPDPVRDRGLSHLPAYRERYGACADFLGQAVKIGCDNAKDLSQILGGGSRSG